MDNLPFLTTEETICRLRQLTEGLHYQSESDFPVEVVQFNASIPNPITKESILTLIVPVSITTVEETTPAILFRNLVKPEPVAANDNNAVNQIANLQLLCEQQLKNVQVFRIGKRTITLLLLGKTLEGVLVGLKTTAVET